MMDNEDITQEEQLNELHAEITELKIRMALLVGGA